MVRFRPTSVTGFPRCGSRAAYHAFHLPFPSSNRTCGFPASGSPSPLSPQAFTRCVLLLGLLGKFLPQSSELGRKSATVASRQSRISGCPLFRSGLVLRQAGLRFCWQQHVYRKAPWLHPSSGASRLLGASPTPHQCRRPGYGFPGRVARRRLAHSGGSQVPGLPVRTRHPQSPRGSPANAQACPFFAGGRLPAIWDPGHSPALWNEAESGSLPLRLARPAHKASHLGSPLAALTRLPGPQALDMVDSFQSTREPRLRLALQIITNYGNNEKIHRLLCKKIRIAIIFLR